MTTPNQTFRAYYSSMTDADLLKLAANRNSYIDIARKTMTDELERRHLSPPVEPVPAASRRGSIRNLIARFRRKNP